MKKLLQALTIACMMVRVASQQARALVNNTVWYHGCAKMTEYQREMPKFPIFQNAELYVLNAELMEMNQEYKREYIWVEATNTKSFDLTSPKMPYSRKQ